QAFDISFDLISGLPYQNKTMLLNDIETMLLYNPAHISLYDLMIEEGTPLSRSLAPGGRGTALPQEEEAEDIWIAGRDYLESAGFSQYEISNFARAGKRARHNIRYWNMQSWLGFGPSASGTLIDNATGTGIRYTVLPDIAAYIVHNKKRGGFIPSYERLDRKTLLRESLMMGFRYIDGPCESLFKQRFSLGIDEAIAKTITIWRARGLYAKNKNALTKDGLLFLNRFLLDCFNELEG
ncbi:MAG: coproporphyrinogen III oxidase family protein, partial [Spirochaetaceae bacterium]|nr:coproporphyrinogen III oxidase family protein [Spirochaetaceae bacterium]